MVTSMPGSGSLSLSSTTGETQAVLPSGVQFVATSVVDAAAGAASIAALAVAAASAATPTARIRRAADAMGRSAVMCRVLRGVRGWPRGSLSGPPFSPWCSSPEQAVNRKGFASEPKCSRGLCHIWQRACHTKGSWLMVVDRGTYHGRPRTRDDGGPTTLRAEGDRAGVVRGCVAGGARPPRTRGGALRRDLALDRTLEDVHVVLAVLVDADERGRRVVLVVERAHARLTHVVDLVAVLERLHTLLERGDLGAALGTGDRLDVLRDGRAVR